MKLRIAIATGVALLASACTHVETNKEVTATIDAVADKATALNTIKQLASTKKIGSTKPLKSIQYPRGEKWIMEEVDIEYKNADARLAIASILDKRPVSYRLGEAARAMAQPNEKVEIVNQPIPKVYSPYGKKRIVDHLDSIASQANWSYSFDNGTIVWTDWETATFDVAVSAGQRTSEIKGQSANLETQNGDKNDVLIQDNPYNEIQEILVSILRNKGFFSVSEFSSSVTVSARPNMVAKVSAAIDRFNYAATRTAVLHAELILVDLEKGAQRAINWNLLREAGIKVNNSVNGQEALGIINTPFSFTVSETSGAYAGSNIVAQILDTQARTSVMSKTDLYVLNNRHASVTSGRVTPYTKNIKQVQTGSNITTSLSPEIEKAQIQEGTRFNFLGTIIDDRINGKLVINHTKVNRFITESFADGDIVTRAPQFDDTQVTVPISIRDGETIVIAGSGTDQTAANAAINPLLPVLADNVDNDRRQQQAVLVISAVLSE